MLINCKTAVLKMLNALSDADLCMRTVSGVRWRAEAFLHQPRQQAGNDVAQLGGRTVQWKQLQPQALQACRCQLHQWGRCCQGCRLSLRREDCTSGCASQWKHAEGAALVLIG